MLDKIGAKSISFILTEMGYVKGKTPPSDAIALEITDRIMKEEFENLGPSKPLQSGGNCNCGGKC